MNIVVYNLYFNEVILKILKRMIKKILLIILFNIVIMIEYKIYF